MTQEEECRSVTIYDRYSVKSVHHPISVWVFSFFSLILKLSFNFPIAVTSRSMHITFPTKHAVLNKHVTMLVMWSLVAGSDLFYLVK